MNDLIQFWTEHTPIFSILIPSVLIILFNIKASSRIHQLKV